MNNWVMGRVSEILKHSILSGMSSSNPFHQGSRIYVEEMIEIVRDKCHAQRQRNSGFSRAIWLILIRTHRDCGIMQKTCKVQARQNPIMENQKWVQSSMSYQGFCTWYLVGEVKSVSLSTKRTARNQENDSIHIQFCESIRFLLLITKAWVIRSLLCWGDRSHKQLNFQ